MEEGRAAVGLDVVRREPVGGDESDQQPERRVGALRDRDGGLGLDEAADRGLEARRPPHHAAIAVLVPVPFDLDRHLGAVRHLQLVCNGKAL